MKKILYLLSFVLIFTFSIQISAQELPEGYDSYIEKVIKEWNVPGCAIVIVKNSKVYYIKGYGYRNVKDKLPVTEKTLFAIGSCTKAFTSASACILVDQGKLDLDKPVITYVPDLKLYDDYVTEHATPRDLM